MPNDMITLDLQLSDGYRAARRTVALLCASALAWSTAQLEFESISFEVIGAKFGLSSTSIPLILFCAILYAATRSTIEYAMQSVETRRWGYAQLDFKLTINLVRAALVMLAVGVLRRSLSNIFYVLLAVGAGAIVFMVGCFLITMVVMLILVWMNRNKPRASAARMAIGAAFMADFFMMVFYVLTLVCFGLCSMYSTRFQSFFWTEPPSALSLWFFVVTCSVVIIDLYFQKRLDKDVFAEPSTCLKKRCPDGKEVQTWREPPPVVWDWCSMPETADEYEVAVEKALGQYGSAPQHVQHQSMAASPPTAPHV